MIRVHCTNVPIVGLDDHRVTADRRDSLDQPKSRTIGMFECPQLTDGGPSPLDPDQALPFDERRLHRAVGGKEPTRENVADAWGHVICGAGLGPEARVQCRFRLIDSGNTRCVPTSQTK